MSPEHFRRMLDLAGLSTEYAGDGTRMHVMYPNGGVFASFPPETPLEAAWILYDKSRQFYEAGLREGRQSALAELRGLAHGEERSPNAPQRR